MNEKGILTLLGFAQKAGNISAGDAAVENFVKKGRTKLLILSSEFSESRRDYWIKQAADYGIECIELEITKHDLGLAVGMSPRGVIGVLDQNMADAVVKKMKE